MQGPGAEILRDSMRYDAELQPYVKAVVGRFAGDRRVIAWDLFNEPDNINGGPYRAFGEFTVNSSLYAVPVYERYGFIPAGLRVEVHGIAFVPMKLAVPAAMRDPRGYAT